MISLNILGLPAPDLSALVTWCAEAKPPYAVVMDNIDLAARVQMASPNTQIIFRRYREDDDELTSTIKPAAFLESVADVPKAYICQAGNEPGGDQALLTTWTAALIRQADQVGRRVAVGSWSVGNPDDEAVANGKYDLILQALADTNERHVLSLHEYFHEAPAQEPYFVGRYRHFLKRADQLGIARPVIVITEHGRDLGGGPEDGWRGQGWTESEYADRLAEAQTVYAPDGITACVFCYGAGFDQRWQSFNVEGAAELLDAMAKMNAEAEVVPWGLKKVQTKAAGVNVNMRAEPKITAPVLRTVKTGDYLRPYGTPVQAGGHAWQRVNDENCKTGWVSLNVVDLVGG